MSMAENYGYSLAERNGRVADHNAYAVDQWMAYANKVKAKLTAVEKERDAMRLQIGDMTRESDALRLQIDKMKRERDAMASQFEVEQARVAVAGVLQERLAVELGKVRPDHPLLSPTRRAQIIEAALQPR